MDQMTPGQAQYVEDASRRATEGEETTVAFTGKRTGYEVVDCPEDPQRPWRVRWTITAEDGATLVLDEWPPLSADEHEAWLADQDAERERQQAAIEKANEEQAQQHLEALVADAVAKANAASQPEG